VNDTTTTDMRLVAEKSAACAAESSEAEMRGAIFEALRLAHALGQLEGVNLCASSLMTDMAIRKAAA